MLYFSSVVGDARFWHIKRSEKRHCVKWIKKSSARKFYSCSMKLWQLVQLRCKFVWLKTNRMVLINHNRTINYYLTQIFCRPTESITIVFSDHNRKLILLTHLFLNKIKNWRHKKNERKLKIYNTFFIILNNFNYNWNILFNRNNWLMKFKLMFHSWLHVIHNPIKILNNILW